MSELFGTDIEGARAVLEKQMAELSRMGSKLEGIRTEVSSPDRSVRVAVEGGQAEITGITFETDRFRSMAPAELEHVIISTIADARAAHMDAVISVMPTSPIGGVSTQALVNGDFEIADLVPTDIIGADFAFRPPGRSEGSR